MSKNNIKKAYIGISRKEFLLRFFELYNVLQKDEKKLTDSEARLLTEILLLPEKYKYSRLSTSARRVLLDTVRETGWKLSYQGLTQLVRALTEKGVLIEDADGEKVPLPQFEALIDKKRTEFGLEMTFQIDNSK